MLVNGVSGFSLGNVSAFQANAKGKDAASGLIATLLPDTSAVESSGLGKAAPVGGASANSSKNDAGVGGSQQASPAKQGASAGQASGGQQALSADQERVVTELKTIDQQVHAHEQAHQSAGAGLTGAASYGYTTGPDGKRYATSGEVNIDVSPVQNNPQAMISKMQRVISAALAPADPSSQDRSVAAQANGAIATATAQLAQQRASKISKAFNSHSTPGSLLNAVA